MNKEQFIDSCKNIVQSGSEKKITIQDASNQVCELCNKNFDTLIVNSPELQNIMDIACDLELPTEHRERSIDDWEKVKDIVHKL